MYIKHGLNITYKKDIMISHFEKNNCPPPITNLTADIFQNQITLG